MLVLLLHLESSVGTMSPQVLWFEVSQSKASNRNVRLLNEEYRPRRDTKSEAASLFHDLD